MAAAAAGAAALSPQTPRTAGGGGSKLPPLPLFAQADLAAGRKLHPPSPAGMNSARGSAPQPSPGGTAGGAPSPAARSPATATAAAATHRTSPQAAATGAAAAAAAGPSSAAAAAAPAKSFVPATANSSSSSSSSSSHAAAAPAGAAAAAIGRGGTGAAAEAAAAVARARPRGASNTTGGGAKGTFTATGAAGAAVAGPGGAGTAGRSSASSAVPALSKQRSGSAPAADPATLAFALARASSRIVTNTQSRVEQLALDQRLRVLGVLRDDLKATTTYLSYGANPNSVAAGSLPHAAGQNGGQRQGGGQQGNGSGLGHSLLGVAIDQCVQLDIVRVLCEHGADVEHADRYGRRPLMLAAIAGSLDLIQLLLRHGALPEPCDVWGKTALQHLLECEFNTDEAQRVLLEALNARRDAICNALSSVLPPGETARPRSVPVTPVKGANSLSQPSTPGMGHQRRSSGNNGGWLPEQVVDMIDEYCTFHTSYTTSYPLSRHMLTDEQEQVRKDHTLMAERAAAAASERRVSLTAGGAVAAGTSITVSLAAASSRPAL